MCIRDSYNPSKIVNFFVDTGLQYPEEKNGHASLIFDVGAAYIIGHDIQIDLSVGTGAAGTKAPSSLPRGGFLETVLIARRAAGPSHFSTEGLTL